MFMHIAKRRNPTRVKFTLSLALALLAVTSFGPVSAATLATFECQEIMGRDWPRTLITYPVEFQPGQVKPGSIRLLDAEGQEQPCQLWRAKLNADGSLASGRVSFYAQLPRGGSYRYTLETGKPAAATSAPQAIVEADLLTLDNGKVALRLPAGVRDYTGKPLVLVQDRPTAVKNLARLEKAGLAFGPIAGIRLNDGKWVGGSYFTTESIEAVRFRQKDRAEPVTAEMEQAASKAAPKVVAYHGQITEQGPLFVEAVGRFEFDNGGHYQLTTRVLRDDPAVRLDELMDLKGNCPSLDPLYVAMVLQDGHQSWKPDAALLGPNGRKKYAPMEDALKAQGFASKYGTVQIDDGADRSLVADVVAHYPWEERNIHYLGVVNTEALKASKAAPFLGIMPVHAGAWRADHWVFPPQTTAPLPGTPGLEGWLAGDALDHPRPAALAGCAAHRRIRPGVRPDRHATAVGTGWGRVPIP
jgi:hypothetical protein